MSEFLTAALGFPAVLFGVALIVVIAFWLLVLAGAAEHDAFNSQVDTDGTATGLGGVPATIPVSLLIAIAWFASLAGSVLVRRRRRARDRSYALVRRRTGRRVTDRLGRHPAARAPIARPGS